MALKHQGEEKCVVKCSADIGVKLNAAPKVTCREVGRKGTSFNVAFKTKVNPRCQIRYKGSKQSSCDPCEHTCYFAVDVDADCEAEVVNTACGKSTLDYEMKVNIPVSPECEVKNICKDKPKCKPKAKPQHDSDHGVALPKNSNKILQRSNSASKSGGKSNNYAQQLARDSSSRAEKTIRA